MRCSRPPARDRAENESGAQYLTFPVNVPIPLHVSIRVHISIYIVGSPRYLSPIYCRASKPCNKLSEVTRVTFINYVIRNALIDSNLDCCSVNLHTKPMLLKRYEKPCLLLIIIVFVGN